MNNNDNPTVKLGKSRAARAWLRKYKDDPIIGGEFSACLPYSNYTKVLNFDRRPVVEALQQVMGQLSPKEQKLAKLFLEMPPRKIAKVLRVRPAILYERLRSLREKALALAAVKRDKYTNQRSRALTPKDLDTHPSLIARRTLRLTLGERVAHCYLVERDGDSVWVDENGAAFGKEVQEILHNAEEDVDGEVLEIESV